MSDAVRWYSKVRDDTAQLVNAMDYYNLEFETACKEAKLAGHLEQASQKMPGLIAHRFGQLQEIEAILEHLNIMLRQIKGGHYRKYIERYNKVLSSRDAEKFADNESDVVDMYNLVNEFALVRNKFLGIIKALETKGFQINNITRLRCAGLDDVTL
jgi:hypothetical protein